MAPRERGSAIVLAILGIVLMMALTGSLTMLLIAEAKAVAESSRRMSAFFLAESGFEAAKHEIGESTDPDGDGPGNVNALKLDGSYSVTATDLGSDRYELTSTGTSGDSSVTLKMITVKSFTTMFPPSALAILGHSGDINVELNPDVSLDGADSPAVVFTHQSKFDAFAAALVDAVTQGILPLGNLLGAVTSLVSSLNLPLLLEPNSGGSGDGPICNELYTDFVNRMRGTVLPALTPSSLPGGSTITYGTSSSPVTVYLNTTTLLPGGKSLSGFGTLIVTDELRIDPSASLDWTGNVIVLARDDQDAKLDVRGNVSVNGSLLVAGGRQKTVKLEVKTGGSLTVNGALTLMADFTTNGKIDLMAESPFQVNGLFQALAVEHKLDFRSLSQVILNGQMGLGPGIDPAISSKLDLRLLGYTTLYKDTQKVEQGAAALAGMDQLLGQTLFATRLVHPTMTTEAWWQYYP